MIHDNKAVVGELVERAMNTNEPGVVDRLCSPQLAPKLVTAFSEFRAAFPDWHQELLEVVAEGDRVVARCRCTGTHQGAWQGLEPTGRTMRVDEVYFFRFRDDVISSTWGLEDTWTRMRQLAGGDATLGELGSLS